MIPFVVEPDCEHYRIVTSIRPSETQRGRAWLTNFAEIDRPTAARLLNSLQIANPADIHHSLKSDIQQLIPTLQDDTGVLIPVLSIEDINLSSPDVDRVGPTRVIDASQYIAYESFRPGADLLPATPGSEAAIGNLIRDLTGDRAGEEPSQWLHPNTDIDTLRSRRCRLIVLVTDYSGSGQQVNRFAATFTRNAQIRSWRSFRWLRIAVVTYAASAAARATMESATHIDDVYVHTPAASFDDAEWTAEERSAIEMLCKRYTPTSHSLPLGYRDSGGLYFTHTSVPNNLPFILRRSTPGWHPFLIDRAVPEDLATELGHFQALPRNLADIARAANQTRLGRAIDGGRLPTPADKLIVVLALISSEPQTCASLAHRFALPDDEIATIIKFLVSVDFITNELTITTRGRIELRHSRRLERTGDCPEFSDVHSALSALVAVGRVARVRRGVYVPAPPEISSTSKKLGLHPQTVRSVLTTFGAVVQSYTDQGVLPRNVIALVERPKNAEVQDTKPAINTDDYEPTFKSWTLAEVTAFREFVRDNRLFACWLLSCYGLRRSEVLGLRWSAIDLDTGTLSVRRGRVAVGSEAVEGPPKSKRSRRDLPLPADVTDALRALRQRQRTEAIALGHGWSDDRLVAVREDSLPLRPESYADEFQRLRSRAGLRRIKLHGLRNTSVSLMLDQGHPPHIVAGWHGHDPAVALSIYSDVKADELRAVGASLFC